ncbi:MAG: S41 family peptidase [Candidatus Hydrogenedentes bacterium]|nr:S41 family peptidase [Candidatus Hydrogenedentota bacterium]
MCSFAESDPTTYVADWKAFAKEIDDTYPFFDLKNIRADWNTAKPQLEEHAKACTTDAAFLGLIIDAFRVLRDSHMSLSDTQTPLPQPEPEYCPRITFMPATDHRVIVMTVDPNLSPDLKVGTIILRIDGDDAYTHLEKQVQKNWETMFASSFQRARLYAYRIPLRGKQGESHIIHYLVDGEEKEITVTNNAEARGWPHVYNMPEPLTRFGRSFLYGTLESGVGYMYLRRVDQSVTEGMKEALDKHKDVKGWVVDLRGNGGGGYDQALLDMVKSVPKPVAVIIDAGCISAGETLARDFAELAEARLFGSTTAGASSSKRQWKFPSGIATVSLPTRSRWRADGKPIEFNGIEPDEVVEPDPAEVLAGKNSELLRAEAYVLKRSNGDESGAAAGAAAR